MSETCVTELVALGHAGSEHYVGLETFPNPGVTRVEMTSDELTAVCPITGQPDMYVATIAYSPRARCLPLSGIWPRGSTPLVGQTRRIGSVSISPRSQN